MIFEQSSYKNHILYKLVLNSAPHIAYIFGVFFFRYNLSASVVCVTDAKVNRQCERLQQTVNQVTFVENRNT